MKIKTIIAFTTCFMLLFAMSVAAEEKATPSGEHKDHSIKPMDGKDYGEIQGKIKSCEKGGPSGIEIHVTGHSATVRVGDNGEFSLHHLPPGEHSLVFERGPADILTLTKIPVEPESLTVIGEVTVCPADAAKAREFSKSTFKKCPQGGFICPHIERLHK